MCTTARMCVMCKNVAWSVCCGECGFECRRKTYMNPWMLSLCVATRMQRLSKLPG